MKRLFDIVGSVVGLAVLTPLFVGLAIWIKKESKGPIFYKQKRVGRNGKEFQLFKFRSMKTGSDKLGLLTIGGSDPRITRAGNFIRKFKLDEFPQLINVIIGNMSIVGPRPEVAKYVNLYNEEQLKVLKVKPGITDWASIKFRNENELLAKAEKPEEFYISEVMPAKLALSLQYIEKHNLITDLRIIWLTLKNIVYNKQ